MDPPLHGLRSGLMEYPTFITVGTMSHMPANIRTMQSLAAHEFAHQYFMGMVATNEKEEAWLDEGFVTYFEDKIMDTYYGDREGLFNVFGYRTGNAELSRLEYTSMTNPNVGIIARPGWEIESNYKALIYSKTATVLKSLERLVGQEVMDKIIKTYFERWKFKHPRGEDFIEIANEVYKNEGLGLDLNWFFDPLIYGTASIDFLVSNISHTRELSAQGLFDKNDTVVYKQQEDSELYISRITVERRGELKMPTTLLLTFEDRHTTELLWDGVERYKVFEVIDAQKVVAAHIDPDQKIYLDLDLNNNSLTIEPTRAPLYKYGAKIMFWVQSLVQTISMFL